MKVTFGLRVGMQFTPLSHATDHAATKTIICEAAMNLDDERDDLEEFIAECAQHDPGFPALVEAALQRRLAMQARGEDPNEEESSTDSEATALLHPRSRKLRRFTTEMDHDPQRHDTKYYDTEWEALLKDPRARSNLERLAEEAHQEYLRGETQDLDEFLAQTD